jgi:sugar-specific transcriptional regulator TrmB
MYEKLLEESGLTHNESLIYLALLRLGKAKSGEIVREAKVSGGKIYETIYKLIDKGLVKEVSEQGVKHFLANDPKSLLIYLQEKRNNLLEKEKEIEKNLPTLINLKSLKGNPEGVELVKGLRGISPLVYSALKNAKEISIMGVNSSKDEKYNNFWRHWHEERAKNKQKARMIFSDKNTEYWKFFRNLEYTSIKEISPLSPSAIMIIDDQSFLFSYEKEVTCIHISSSSTSKSLLNFFEDIWKIAKK